MATASKIKSAIRSRGASQRQLTGQLAGVTEQLMKGQESSMMAQFEDQEKARMYGTLSAGLEAGASFLEGVKQRQEIQSNIDFLTESLGEQGKELSMVRGDKSSLMDVFSGKASMSSYLFGQQQYELDGQRIGTKYDVSAMGEKAKALQQDNMLDNFLGKDSLFKKQDVGLDTLETAKMPSLTGGPSPLPDYASIEREGGGGLESPKEIKLPTKQDTMMDKVGEKIEKGTLVKSDGNVIPEKIVDKVEDIPPAWMETADEDMEGNKIKPNQDSISDFLKPSVDQPMENEKLSSFLPDYLQSKDELGPVADRPMIKETDSFQKPSSEKFSELLQSERKAPEFALADIGERIEKISKLEKGEGVMNPQTRKNFLEAAESLKGELKQDILSIYNPDTNQWKSKEFEKIFTKGTGKVGEKKGFAKVSKRRALGLQSQVDIDLSSVDNFIQNLFNENNLASK